MRLTLRTMLAHMDDVLEPADAEDVKKKIEGSKFASELSQRIRACLRLARLPAPPLNGRGLAMDANSVAEYLNYTLPDERVPDFEKICLESDSHLAEVAACHQILALVLSEPVDVDPAARERMYALIDRSEPAPPPPQAPLTAPPVGAANAASAAASPMSDVAQLASTASRRSKPQVPDYLRETRSSRVWPVAAVGVIAFVLVSGLMALFAPQEWRELASGVFQKGQDGQAEKASAQPAPNETIASPAGTNEPAPVAEPQGQAGGAIGQPSSPDVGSATSPAGAQTTAAAGQPTPAANPEMNAAARQPVAIPGVTGPAAELGPEPAAGAGQATIAPPIPATMPAAPGSPTIAANPPAFGPELANPFPANPVPTNPATPAGMAAGANPVMPGPAPANPAGPFAGSAAGGPIPGPITMPDSPPAAAPGTAAPPPRSGDDVGRYLSEQDVLLRHDAAAGGWRRVAAKSGIAAGDQLLSLPAYRPVIVLSNGVKIEAVGPSDFTIKGFDDKGAPIIVVRSGRLIAGAEGRPETSLRFEFGDRSGLATFADGNSVLALEVERSLPPGADPEAERATTDASVFALSGSIRWEENGRADVVAAPAGRSLAPTAGTQLAGADAPKWIAPSGLKPIEKTEKSGADAIEKALPTDRPILLPLKELTENKRTEIRSLAIRAGGYVGQYEPIVNAFGNDEERNDWPRYFDTLRAALARGPDAAAQIREAFERHRGADAQRLYRMLWGYSLDQFKDGAALDLVEGLNNDSLDVRVLSFLNLQNITGATLFYRPEQPLIKRRPMYVKWKDRVRDNSLIAKAAERSAKLSGRPKAAASETPEP